LGNVPMRAPSVPVVSNVLAAAISDPVEIRRRLVEQVTGTVRWRECVEYMARNGVTDMVEVGHGKVLAGLAGRIDKSLKAMSVGGAADLATVVPVIS
ncbi:MAG: malonyl CoA-acyl carrier protein transacylase, partial [Hyphomicrobiaceae bacterium]|nr:malonyl CoA-acyl carrier protein transacylase [Hyphomicrobiaceae bacterium]